MVASSLDTKNLDLIVTNDQEENQTYSKEQLFLNKNKIV